MKVHKKIVSVILIIGLIIGSVSVNPIEAKTVEVKTKSSNSELTISLLNKKLDYNLKEIAFKIKNKSEKKVKVTRVKVQFESKGEWTTLKTKEKSVAKRTTVISAGNTTYDSVNINTDYVISKDGLAGGKYAIYIKYKYKGKHFYKRKVFYIEGKTEPETTANEKTTTVENVTNVPEETTNGNEQETTSNVGEEVTTKVVAGIPPVIGMTPSSKGNSNNYVGTNKATATSSPTINIKLVNTDFSIRKNGKATAMVFSEADYKNANKAKIYVSIQRKIKGKWKKYKRYKVVKQSNIAFINKQLTIKKKGTYRMWVKIIFHGNGNQRKQYKTKSEVQVY